MGGKLAFLHMYLQVKLGFEIRQIRPQSSANFELENFPEFSNSNPNLRTTSQRTRPEKVAFLDFHGFSRVFYLRNGEVPRHGQGISN